MNKKDWIANNQPNLVLAQRLKYFVWFFSVAVFVLVGFMRGESKIPLPDGVSLAFLPAVHAVLNSLVALLLVVGLIMIKLGNVRLHQIAVSAAMICSAIFLLCYVAYHFTTPETRYGGEGLSKAIYLTILISHIAAAALSLPFILLTWVYGFTHQFEKHRKLAKRVFPVWLYVAITGPICYLMLRPYY